MKKRFLLLAALACASIVAASSANATPQLLVTGAGASTTSGDVVVNARATGPATGSFFPVAPAVGFLRALDTGSGDLNGSVTCIGLASPRAAIVSGNLETPFVSGGFTYPNFSLIVVVGGGAVPPWIELFADNLVGLGPCGTSLFFSPFIPDFPNDLLVKGHFVIGGAS